MNLKTLAFITGRLTLNNKNKGIVHIVSLISLLGVAVGSFALIVVLSVFNGFTSVAETMLEKTCPPLLITNETNLFNQEDFCNTVGINLEGGKKTGYNCTFIPVIKQTALVSTGSVRTVAVVMGIDPSYFVYNNLDSCIVSGKEGFDVSDSLFFLTGVNQASLMGLHSGAEKMNIPVKITVPAPENKDALVIEDKLSSVNVFYQACYQTHSDLDENTVFIHIDRARQLLNMNSGQCNYIYAVPDNVSQTEDIKKQLTEKSDGKYSVKTVLEQEPVYFRIVKSEKLAVYFILAFIIFIATINIISTVIILNIQKERMNKILRTMGVRIRDLRKIYFSYGFVINLAGCLSGICCGLILCLLQQHFGLVKLAQDAFVVDAFPVKIMVSDVAAVFILVNAIGCLTIRAITSRIKEKI